MSKCHPLARLKKFGAVVGVLATIHSTPAALADTLPAALARAYAGNPSLGAARASVRAADEAIPQALAGYRPTVSADAYGGLGQSRGSIVGLNYDDRIAPVGAGLTVNQALFDGFQTQNRTRQAEARVLGNREDLRNTEMSILFAGVQAYMNVLRDTAVLELQRSNLEVLTLQLGEAKERYAFGQVTLTDLAQAEARIEASRVQEGASVANLRISSASYRRIIGTDPQALEPGRPVGNLLPTNLNDIVSLGLREHPQVLAAQHAVDAAEAQVHVAEGQLLPQVSLLGSVAQANDQQFANSRTMVASLVGRISVPLYEGGRVYSQVREAKEIVGQRRMDVEVVRDAVRAEIMSAWETNRVTQIQVLAAERQVRASEKALSGVREEARVGQRTTLDILNAQQELLNARVTFVSVQRDRVVASYRLAASVGRLTVRSLKLDTPHYSSKIHFDQVKNLWFGVGTPDGR